MRYYAQVTARRRCHLRHGGIAMGRESFYDELGRLAMRALSAGADHGSVTRLAWNAAGSCEAPVYRELVARGDGRRRDQNKWFNWDPSKTGVLIVDVTVRCRVCPACLEFRRRLWAGRALGEWRTATAHDWRTWMGTFTLRPEEHLRIASMLRVRMAQCGEDFDTFEEKRQFSMRHGEVSKYFTLWLKRVRARIGIPLRFLLVAEAHKSGLPHYHMLIHQAGPGVLRYHDLRFKTSTRTEPEWPYGFTEFRLVEDAKHATYACKYLAKSSLARVRASLRYGVTT